MLEHIQISSVLKTAKKKSGNNENMFLLNVPIHKNPCESQCLILHVNRQYFYHILSNFCLKYHINLPTNNEYSYKLHKFTNQ